MAMLNHRNPPRDPNRSQREEIARRNRAVYESLKKRNILCKRKNVQYNFVTNINVYWCDLCNKFLFTIDELEDHLHKEHQKFICRKCGLIEDEHASRCPNCNESKEMRNIQLIIRKWPDPKSSKYKQFRRAVEELMSMLYID